MCRYYAQIALPRIFHSTRYQLISYKFSAALEKMAATGRGPEDDYRC